MSEVEPLTAVTLAGDAHGKYRRKALPRDTLQHLGTRPNGFDPLKLLEAQELARVQSLIPLRAQRMAESEFAFLRGAAAIMAYDLAMAPSTGIDAQLCGDAHISNFGIFNSPERRLVFDVNDFDETLPGPFEWDVKRMVASGVVALSHLNFSDKQIEKSMVNAVRSYRLGMQELARKGTLEGWYAHFDIEGSLQVLRETFRDEKRLPIDDIISRARKSDSKKALKKLTEVVDGSFRFRSDPPLLVPVAELLGSMGVPEALPLVLAQALANYGKSLPDDRAHLLNNFQMVDIARKVVGVGSVGTRCFVMLLMGRDIDDPLILQVKEAMPSVLEAHLGPSHYETASQRVVEGQRLMQTTPDIFLGHIRANFSDTEYHDFYFRQFHDGKASVNLEMIDDIKRASTYMNICAWTLARAHARSGDRAAIASYLGTNDSFDRAIATWAMAYREQNSADYASYQAAIASGRITVAPAPEG